VVDAVDTTPSALPAASTPEPVPEASPSPSAPSTPQSSGIGESTALAAAGAAGLIAAAPRAQAAPPAPAKRPRRATRRQVETAAARAQAPRQVGSTEVPVVEFVGTKSRQQVIAEMMEARRAANRQAANGNYFPSLSGPSARR
jgi:hypothetical protein